MLATVNSKLSQGGTILEERQRLHTMNRMNRLSFDNNQLKFKTSEKLPIILHEFIECTPIY